MSLVLEVEAIQLADDLDRWLFDSEAMEKPE